MLASPRAPTIPKGRQHTKADIAASIAAAGAPLSIAFTNDPQDCATDHLAGWNTALLRAIHISATTQTKTCRTTRPGFDVGTVNANTGRTHKSNRLSLGLAADFNLMNLVLSA